MILTIPDETYKRFMERSPNTSPTVVMSHIRRYLDQVSDLPLDRKYLLLDEDDLRLLQEMFGSFDSSAELVRKVRNLGTVKVQGEEFLLTDEQMKRLKQEAFGNHKKGEPRSESEATPVQARKMVQRYLREQIDYYMRMMCSQI